MSVSTQILVCIAFGAFWLLKPNRSNLRASVLIPLAAGCLVILFIRAALLPQWLYPSSKVARTAYENICHLRKFPLAKKAVILEGSSVLARGVDQEVLEHFLNSRQSTVVLKFAFGGASKVSRLRALDHFIT